MLVSEDTESKILSYLSTTNCRMVEDLNFFVVRSFSQLTAVRDAHFSGHFNNLYIWHI